MVRCCFCQSVHKKGCGRTYHKFPLSNIFLLEQWVNNIPLKHFKPSNERLCSDHFTEDCFDRSGFKVRLKLNSVPTRFGDSLAACIMCKRKRVHQSSYSLFRFPLEKSELLNKWLENMNMLNWRPTETSRLCSSHFEISCLRKVKGKYWTLKENSIPTIFTSSDCSSPYETPEFLVCKENISPSSESNITNSILHNKSQNVLTINPIPVDEARRESSHDSDITIKTLHNSDDAGTGLTSMTFNSTISPVCKSRRIIDQDHLYKNSSTMMRRKLFVCEQKLKEKEKIIKFQKRKISPVCKSRRIIDQNHLYKNSSATLRRKLFVCEQKLKEKEKIIKFQKWKINRLQRKVSSFQKIINEHRSSVKVQVSETCLRSLKSIVDPGVKEFSQRVIDNGESNSISRMQYHWKKIMADRFNPI